MIDLRGTSEAEWEARDRLQYQPQVPRYMTTLSWNIRGLTRPSFKNNFLHLVSIHNPDVVILTETRVGMENSLDIMRKLPFDSHEIVEPVGFAGGIVVLWNSSNVVFNTISKGSQSVHGFVQVTSKNPFYLTAVYGNPKFRNRKVLWHDLIDFASHVNGPWSVIRDFNDITNENEKFGGRHPNRRKMEAYRDCMNRCGLIDIGFSGPKFIWTNKRKTNPIFIRLDRAWVSSEWLACFPDSQLTNLPRITSDHSPILLQTNPPLHSHSPRPFKMEPMWNLDPSFPSLIQSL